MKRPITPAKGISVYPLRLPLPLKDEVARLSRQEGASINQFVSNAVAAKVAAMGTALFFQDSQRPWYFPAFHDPVGCAVRSQVSWYRM